MRYKSTVRQMHLDFSSYEKSAHTSWTLLWQSNAEEQSLYTTSAVVLYLNHCH